jgi:hypothetical protein
MYPDRGLLPESRGATVWRRRGGGLIYSENGWTLGERAQYYHLAEGSELMPYALLANLKSSKTGRPFLARWKQRPRKALTGRRELLRRRRGCRSRPFPAYGNWSQRSAITSLTTTKTPRLSPGPPTPIPSSRKLLAFVCELLTQDARRLVFQYARSFQAWCPSGFRVYGARVLMA